MRGRSASNAAHSSCLGPAALLRDRLQRQEHGAVGEVGPGHDVLDAVQDHRPGGVEQHLVLIGVELAHREAAAGREPAERVGNPRRQARHVVEGQHMAVAGGDEQVAILARQGPQGRGCCPYGVCTTSGWNWMPYSPRSASSTAATGDSVVLASGEKPGGAS